ncbi:hypothetical protein JHY03_70090 (plasmid) [Streptomyces sp. CA-256286]|nr:hypothetical protein JHY03_70090 [Streptomyces sp. CA-256286]
MRYTSQRRFGTAPPLRRRGPGTPFRAAAAVIQEVVTPHPGSWSCRAMRGFGVVVMAGAYARRITEQPRTPASRRTVQPLRRGRRGSDGGQPGAFGGEALQGPRPGCVAGAHLLLGGRFRAELLEGLAADVEVLFRFTEPFTELPVGVRLDLRVGVLPLRPGGAVGGEGLVVPLRRLLARRLPGRGTGLRSGSWRRYPGIAGTRTRSRQVSLLWLEVGTTRKRTAHRFRYIPHEPRLRR